MSKSGYIDLKVNGRLFPTWILMNFKKYKLPEIIREKGEDPCAIKTKEELEPLIFIAITRFFSQLS